MTINRQRKLKLIHARPEPQSGPSLGKVVHDARGTAIWAGELPPDAADGLVLLENAEAAPNCDPYNRGALPSRPDKLPRR